MQIANWPHTQLDAPFSGRHFLGALSAALIAYTYQASTLALNADDIIVNQPASGTMTDVLVQGRWGAYWIENYLQGSNPGGLFASTVGCLLLVSAALFAADLLKLESGFERALYAAISTVSIYYAMVFAFDSVRIAYPFANLCAMGGLWLCAKGRFVIGTLIMVVAPAIYPAATETAGVVVLTLALLELIRTGDLGSLRRPALLVAAILASLVIYWIATKATYAALHIQMNGKLDMSLAALFDWPRIWSLFASYSVPFLTLHTEPYLVALTVVPEGIAFLLFAVTVLVVLARRGPAHVIIGMGLSALMLPAPYALAFATTADFFSPRSLYAFGAVHAAWIALPLALAIPRWPRFTVTLAACGAVIVLANAMQSNNFAYDEAVATQSDIATVNRIIYRIDEKLAAAGLSADGPIPIAVRAKPWAWAGPSGFIPSNRLASWSKEWIFRFVDRRFSPLRGPDRDRALAGEENRPAWPASESVAIKNGAIIVAIN
ncbi:MAG: glucosyltransferase domain-containing protein [Devosia sp.]